MIRLGRREYNVSFVDDCSLDFEDPVSGSDLSVDVFGLDILSRPYRCRIDEKTAVEKKLQRLKNKADFEFPSMALVSWTEREDGPLVTFTCVFKGCFNGKLPEISLKGGMTTKTVTVSLTVVAANGTVSLNTTRQAVVTYLAPTCTIKYAVRGIPKRPSYAKRMDNGTGTIIKRVDGASREDLNILPLAYGGPPRRFDVRIAGYNLQETVDLDALNFDQVGLYSECTEVNAVELRPPDFANFIKRL